MPLELASGSHDGVEFSVSERQGRNHGVSSAVDVGSTPRLKTRWPLAWIRQRTPRSRTAPRGVFFPPNSISIQAASCAGALRPQIRVLRVKRQAVNSDVRPEAVLRDMCLRDRVTL